MEQTALYGYRCNDLTSNLDGDGAIRVAITDSNESGTWLSLLDGVNHSGSGWATDMLAGDPVANGERHSTTDPDEATIEDLSYEDATGWHSWNDNLPYLDCDGTYDFETTTTTTDVRARNDDYYYPGLASCGSNYLP